MRYRLATLLVALALAPLLIAGLWLSWRVTRMESRLPTQSPDNSHRASPQREAEILRGGAALTPGMPAAEVERLMHQPDRVLPLYEPQVKNPKRLGSTHWYFIEGRDSRAQDYQAIRVSLDLNGRVTAVDRLGFDDDPTIR